MSLISLSRDSRAFLAGEIASQPLLVLAFLVMSIVAAVLEVTGLGLIFPLMMLIVRPDYMESFPVVRRVLDLLSIESQRELTLLLVVAIAVIMAAKNLYMAGFNFWQARTLANWKARLSNRLMRIYLFSDFRIHMEKTSSEIIRNLSLCSIVFDQFFVALINVLVNATVALGITVLLLYALPTETAFGVTVLVVTAVVLYFSTRGRFVRIGEESNDLYRERQQLMQQSIGAIREAKILGKEHYFLSEYLRIERGYFRRQGFYNFLASTPALVIETMIVLSMLGLITHVLLINREQPQTLATLGLLAAAMFRLAPQTNRILINLQLLNLGRNALDIVAREIRENEHRVHITQVKSGEQLRGWREIRLEQLDYSYPDSTRALHDVNVTIRRNEFIGITGPSGSGKSTLMMVILGLLKPSGGRFLVDSEPLDDPERLRKWQNDIGYVPQGLFLIESSILGNVAYCEPGAEVDEEAARIALERAQLGDFLESLPEGIRASVGENGSRLSGGQKQRVVIARALYHDPELLAFDEATSALDVTAERAITDLLVEFKGRKTIIAIAHKLTTLRRCDRIIMLEKGSVLDQGSFEELEARCPQFRRLVALSNVTPAPELPEPAAAAS